ncbi:hypothetical protein NJC08_05260, partial [Pseudomonas fluorescens]|uniref:hypothetical protein n=1 Tax=Pseudomonas fluorescens TaxID=294 RepID=UPI00209AF6B0
MVSSSTVAKSCQATRSGTSCTVGTAQETKQAQEYFICTDQIEVLPAAFCRALIWFLSFQVNLLRAALLVHSRGKSVGVSLLAIAVCQSTKQLPDT